MANGFVTSSPAARHGDTITQVDNFDNYAQKFVCPGSGNVNISEIGIWVQRIAGITSYARLAIFTHDAVNDCPEVIVANSDTAGLTIGSDGILKVYKTYSSQPVLTGGTTYWLCFQLNNGTAPNAPRYDHLDTDGTTLFIAKANPGFATGSTWHTHTDINDDCGIYAVYVVSAIDLTIIGAIHNHNISSIDLLQGHQLSIDNCQHGHAIENFAINEISPVISLVIDSCIHNHNAESPDLLERHELTISNAVHNHNAGLLELYGLQQLTISSNIHPHIIEEITLLQKQQLEIADTSHPHITEGLQLAQRQELIISDVSHPHVAESLNLLQESRLSISDAIHNHQTDSLDLLQENRLTISDAIHSHNASSFDLVQSAPGELAISDAIHNHQTDSIDLVQFHALNIYDASHDHLIESIALSEITPTTELAIDGASHNHNVSSLDLWQLHNLSLSNAIHSHNVSSIALSIAGQVDYIDVSMTSRTGKRRVSSVTGNRSVSSKNNRKVYNL